MKKGLSFFLAFVCLALSAMGQRKSVAILETYCAEDNIGKAYLIMIGSNIETGIINNPQYSAYNRAQIQAIIKEHNFQTSGMVNDNEVRRLGQMAGVDYVLASEAALVGQQVFVTAKVLNVETGSYEMSANALMDFNPAAIQTGCENLAVDLLNGGKKPVLRRVIPSSESPVSENAIAGRNAGLPQPNRKIAVKSGLTAYWTFDDGTGKDVTDNGYDGRTMGDIKFITDTPNGYGKALQLLGPGSADRYFFSPYEFSTRTITISFWVKDFSTGNFFKMFNDTYHFVNFCSDNSTRKFKIYSTNGYHEGKYPFSCDASGMMSSGWHHIAIAIQDGQTWLYIDGTLVDQGNGSFYQGKTKVYFGAGGPPMKLDNLRIYDNLVLSAKDIKQIYESEKQQ